MSTPDRIQAIKDQNTVTGIDYVYVHTDQVHLDVFFLHPPLALDNSLVNLDKEHVHILSKSEVGINEEIPVISLTWTNIDGKDAMQLQTEYPGDFSLYTLFIDDPDSRIDPYFNNITFSFKANCPSDLDCAPADPDCPVEDIVDFPINYQARDFWSFRQALLDFAEERYPDWKDRLEADQGIMLAEVMSALGDEMAYFQDRISREGYLPSVDERRSLLYHSKLVDYHLHEAAGSQAWINVRTLNGMEGDLPTGMNLWATGDNGLRIDFEIGKGLAEVESQHKAGVTYFVSYLRNEFLPHIWDEDDLCLPIGSTSMHLQGYLRDIILPLEDEVEGKPAGKWILIKTSPDPSIPARSHLVRVVDVQDQIDPVFGDPITQITWEQEQATLYQLDLTLLTVHANILPATVGQTFITYFIIGSYPESVAGNGLIPNAVEQAIEREGANYASIYRQSIPESENIPLVWLGEETSNLEPEIQLFELDPITGEEMLNIDWHWRRSLVHDFASQEGDRDYSLEPGTWKRIVGYRRIGEEIVHYDYASKEGHTIRFGDNTFGLLPPDGTVFKVKYRLGAGKRTNVPIESIINFVDPMGIVDTVTNPLSAEYGTDRELPEQVKQLAPEAYQAVTYRAVRPEDYSEAVERLDWVQQAGTAFRWTGSWLSAFVTADPNDASVITDDQRLEMNQQLDRFRQAGRETIVMDPKYANLDIIITICVKPEAVKGEVKEQVLEVLFGKKGVRPFPGYFSHDNFTFGTQLYRSNLEAAIHVVEGVRAIDIIEFRCRGVFSWQSFEGLSFDPGKNRIIRLENNPEYPERGSLSLIMKGGV